MAIDEESSQTVVSVDIEAEFEKLREKFSDLAREFAELSRRVSEIETQCAIAELGLPK